MLVDAGYQGLTRDRRDQVSAPPLKLRPGRLPSVRRGRKPADNHPAGMMSPQRPEIHPPLAADFCGQFQALIDAFTAE